MNESKVNMEKETLATVIPEYVESKLRDMRCIIPAKIESYNKATRRADVTPSVQYYTPQGIAVELKTITDVPVGYQGGKSCVIDIEYQAGDSVLLGFADYGIGNWKASAGTSQELPDDLSAHRLTGAIVICGIAPEGFDLSSAPTISVDKDKLMTITNQTGTIAIKDDGQIDINNGNLTVDV